MVSLHSTYGIHSTESYPQYWAPSNVLIVSLYSTDGIPPQSWMAYLYSTDGIRQQCWTPCNVLMVSLHSTGYPSWDVITQKMVKFSLFCIDDIASGQQYSEKEWVIS